MLTSTRSREIATGVFIIAGVAVGFLLGEGAMRAMQEARFGAAQSVEKSSKFRIDPGTGLRLPKPGSVHGQIRYNSLGFRGPEIVQPKPPGTVRIAFLGNSTTLDAFSGEADNWAAVAARRVGEHAAPCGVDYLNAGVPGFATDRVKRYYESHIAALTPDLVVILPRDLNLDFDNYMIRRGLHDGVHYRPSWLAAHSVLWAKVEMNATIIARQRRAERSQGRDDVNPAEVVEPFAGRLQSLVDSVRASGAVPILMQMTGRVRWDQDEATRVEASATDLFYMPYSDPVTLLKIKDEYNEALRQVATRNGVSLLEQHAVVPGDAVHFRDSLHFTPVGSRFVGDRVGSEMLETREVRTVLTRCAGTFAAPGPGSAG